MNEAREIHNFLLWKLPYLLWDLACFMGRSFSCSEKCSSMKQRTIRYAGAHRLLYKKLPFLLQ